MAWVQGNAAITGLLAGGIFNISFGSPVTPGSCVVIGVTTYNGAQMPAGVTDDKGNTYTQSDQAVDSGAGGAVTTYYLTNIRNLPTTLTLDMGRANTAGTIAIHEYSGIVTTADPRDGHAINFQHNPTPTTTDGITSGNITTTVNGDTIWGYVGDTGAFNNSPAIGTGFAQREIDATNTAGWTSEDEVQVTAGVTAATFTSNQGGNNFITAVMALKAAPIPPPVTFLIASEW
jgi:hypothetical protein